MTPSRHDALGRLRQTIGSATGVTQFAYWGAQLVAEYDGAGAIANRYVPGPDGQDDPVVWYAGSDLSAPRWLHADNLGTVIGVTDISGALVGGAPNTYDEYGVPASTNLGRFQYTGQMWMPEINLYSYKARLYSPTLGRFMQTDPIGYGSDMNMYAYVGNDPINGIDPSGMDWWNNWGDLWNSVTGWFAPVGDVTALSRVTVTAACSSAACQASKQAQYAPPQFPNAPFQISGGLSSNAQPPPGWGQPNQQNVFRPNATPQDAKGLACGSQLGGMGFMLDVMSVPPGGGDLAGGARIVGGVASLGISMSDNNNAGMAVGVTGLATPVAAAVFDPAMTKAEAEAVPLVGSIVAAGAVKIDVDGVNKQYAQCMNQK